MDSPPTLNFVPLVGAVGDPPTLSILFRRGGTPPLARSSHPDVRSMRFRSGSREYEVYGGAPGSLGANWVPGPWPLGSR